MKLCKDCKHCVITINPEKSKCLHPEVSPTGAEGISLVTGETLPAREVYFCSVERESPTSYAYPCGREGKLFEPISAPEHKSPATPEDREG